MRNKILCLCLSLFMVVSYLPASVMTAFAAPINNLETNKEDTSPKLILDKESDIKDVFVYKILDGSEYEKDAFGLISYTDSFKKDSESSKEFLEVDDFYSKLLDLFKDIKDLEDVNKKSSSDSKEESEKVEKEITQEDINKESLELYDEISEFLDESKQLQFNKDRELTDLTEGVYLIFSENMYPQFINITDSDKDVNIKLEENKSVNKDAQKNSSDNETPKATPKKGGPLKIASSDTEGLATDVSISKFELSITGNSGNFETINDQQVYVIKPGNAYETKKLNWKLEYALSATGSYPAESIEIRIPRYYANKLNLDNTETLYTSNSVVPSVPAYPSYNSSGFGYKYDSNTKEYVITNVIGIDGGSTGFFEFEYEYNQYATRIKDETLQIPLTATLNIQTGDEGLKTQNSNEINWMYDTAVEARNINSLLNNKYDTWQDEWGEAPADADDYFYVTYAFSGEIRKPAGYPGTSPTQSYTVQINNSTWNNDFVYGWIKYHDNILTDSSTGLKYSPIYYSSTNPMNSNTYKSMYDDSNIRKFNTSSMQDGVIFTDYASSYPAWYDGIVLARYPKSLQTETEYDVENTITMTVHPTNGNDEDSTVTYTRTDTLKNINWETPPGNYSLNKYTYRSTLYGLKSLSEGSSIGHIYYRSNFSGSNYQKTVLPGESVDDPNNYGKRNVHYEFVDDMLFLSDENTLLGPNDYEFESLYAGSLKLSDYVADDSTGQYISQTILTSDSRYKSFIENGGLVCWGKYEDGWKKLATIAVDSSNKVTWQIEDTSLVSTQGSAVSFNSSTSLIIPYLRLVKNSGCIGYKFTVDSNMYQVELGTTSTTSGDNYNNVVRLLGSDRVKTWASNHLSTGGYLYNLNTLNVTDSEGNNLALEGEIQEDSSYTNDINGVLTTINNKDTTDYGRPLYHDAVRTKLEPFDVTSGIAKEYSNTTNDTTNEVYKINYDIYGAAEEYKGLPVDAIVTNNVLNDNAYEYLVENNYIDDFTEDYIFYDLLPKGLIVDEATIKVKRTTNLYTDSYTTSWGYYLRDDMSTMSPNEYDYEIIPNYNNSGRDMLKVTCHTKPGIHVYSNTAVRMYSLHYTGLYSWDSFFDYGTTLRNIVATKWGTTSIANGRPDNGPTGSSYTNEEKLTMTNLDPTADNPNFLYTYHTHKISAGVSGTSGLYKRVKGSKGDFETNSTVSPQSTYQYKIRYAAESNTEVSSIVFYDSLENYKPTGVTESWKGKLQSIDVSQLESKGIDVKIYYSNTNNLDISQHQDLNDSVWISADTYGSDLSNVKAFAIDCRYKTNSEEFILGEKESLAVIVNMLSDVSNPNELFENNIKAYNEIYSRIKVRRLSQDFGIENLIHQGYTSIGITVPTTKFIGQKRWLDENDTIRPESVTIELLRNGTPYREQTITANDNWKFEFNDLLKQDNNLEDYVYSVREKSTPNNYTAEIETDLSYYNGTAITFGDHFATESTSYDWVSIYYKDENNNLQQLRGQGSSSGKWGGSQTSSNSLAGKTIYVPSKDVYIYWRSDSSNVAYGFDVISMDLTHIEDITTIQSATATLPTNTIIENSDTLPATAHDYSNYEESLWHYTMGSGNFSLITNKQTSKSISGQKIWSGDTQSARPESITVKLLRNGEEYQSKSVTAANNWQYIFNNLPVFDENDNLYHYTIEESHINGYITRYSNGETTVETPTEGYNDIENIWNPRVITITKQWLNSKGGDDTEFRPEDITVHLKRKQNPLQKIGNLFRTQVVDEQHTLELEYITDPTKWVKDGNTWTYTFSIPENEYDWEVYEEAIEYYNESNLIANPAEVENNVVTITNDFEPQLHIKGTKHWPEGDEAYRPESITVNLLRNNQIINTKTVNASTNWEYDFGYYPVYDSNNNEYNYSLSENQLDDYISVVDEISNFNGTAITFGDTFDTETTCDYLKIYYKDENNNIRLLTGQGASGTTGFCGSGTNMANKTVYVPSDDIYFYWHTDSSVVRYGFDIVNIEPATIDIESITSTSGTIPSYSVEEVTDESNYPKTAHNYGSNSNKLWHYKGNISSSSSDGFNITNILNKQVISGNKTWVGDTASTRPESITVNLYQDGRKIDSQEVTADNNWSYTFTNVPIYKSDGSTKYEYYVEEEPVENYFTNYDKSHAGVRVTFGNDLSITNSNAFMTILYKDSAGTWTRLIGQGSSNNGQWNSSNINSLKNKTIEIPSLEFYITWHGINTSQKWNVTNIEVCDDISIQGQTLGTYSTVEDLKRAYATSTEIEINNDNLPVAPYNNKYEVLYHFNGTNEYRSNNLVNTYNLFNIEGTVSWRGDSDNKGLRPNKVILDLYQNDVLLTTQELAVTSDDIQNFAFNDIPRLDENGNEYHYVVHQRDIDNYRTSNIDDLNILNECTKRNVTGYKVWVNDKNRNSRPESIKVILYDENNNKIAEKTVTSADEFRENCWKYTFENVDVFDNNGNIKSYHVEEEIDTKEYYTGYIPNQWYKYSTENEYLINSSAQEIWQSRQELPPNISDELFDSWFDYLDDNNIPLQIGEWNNLTSEYQELFTEWFNNYRDEMLANYFDENHLYGYNYDLGNTYIPIDRSIYSESKLAASVGPLMDLTSIVNVYRVKHIDGVKHWEDEGSQYQRPDSVTLGLYRNGEKVDEQVITADNDWKYSFVDLPEVDSEGNLYDYDIREEDLDNYITEYNPGDVTEGVQVTFDLPVNLTPYYPPVSLAKSSSKYGSSSDWQQNNIYDNFSPRYGLVTVFKDGNTWYKMTLEEWKNIPSSSSSGGGEYYEKSAKAAAGPGTSISGSSGITFTIPSKEFYIIPVFRYVKNEDILLKSAKGIGDPLVPSLKSYKTVKLSDDDKAKLDYVRSVSKVEFPANPDINTFDYHMYNYNEYGILFEKLGSSFNINDEADHVIELKTADLPDFLDEYITEKENSEYDVESWIHRVAFHYNEELGLTNYPLDAKTSYSGTKIWNNNIEEDDATDSPSCFGNVAKAAAKVNKLTIKAATQVTQPTSVTIVLLQDGHQYATQTIGKDTDWKFEFNDLPMFDPADHHKYEYSIKEKSVKGYKTEILPDEETNGHQVILSSDISIGLSNTIYVLCRYNGQWYRCDNLPDEWSYSNINNKLKLYIPGDDFKILVRSNAYSQNEITDYKENAIANGQNPENYIKIDSIKAVNIPYEIHDYGDYMYYSTLNQWNYYWDAVNLDDLPVPEYTSINLEDGSTHVVTLDQILEGYDSTNPEHQINEFYNLYQYTSKVTSGIKIINTYYEGSFKIKKVDEQGRILPGCEFSLFYANSDGDTWTKAENDPTAINISDENGMVSFENIPYGDYLLYETKPANGYRTPSKPWKVSINTNGSATIWDENGKLVPIQGSDKDYDMRNGVRITFNEDTDIPYNYLYIIAKNESTDSAIIYRLNGPSLDTYSKKYVDIPTKDFYIAFMNENGRRGTDTKSALKLFDSKVPNTAPYGFKVESIEPIETSWNDIYNNNNYNVQYDSHERDGITWDQFFNNYSDMIDVVECNNYPESAHYDEFMEYLNKDKSTSWHYDASNIISDIDEFEDDALFEGSIITFGDNNHASPDEWSNNEEMYYNEPILAFEYKNQYYMIPLSRKASDLNNISIKVPSNNVWLMMGGIYYPVPKVELRGNTIPSGGVDSYGYDLGNEIVDVESITKCMMTKADVQYALNSSMYQEPKSAESEFKPEFELTGEKQEIHWMTDTLGDDDAVENKYYKAYYHYQNDAMGLIPIYEIANELTRTETILVNTEDEPIPEGVLQIIDKDGNVVDSWSTTDEWHITWGLTEGEEYTIHQVSTPYPYRVATDDTFEVLEREITYVKVINDKVKDVTISKTVSGSGASTNDVFNYHVTITNGEHNINHIVETPNGNLTLTTDNTGSGSLDFTMKHNESVKIKGVYKDAIVTVTESANKYVASYKVDNGERTTNPTNNMDITSTITMGDANVSIAFENTLTMILPTGVYLTLMDILPFIMLGLCLAGMAVVYRKNKTKKINLVK